MSILGGPERGESISAGGVNRAEGPEGTARSGQGLERPARLEDGDFLEAVSLAVLRELEGGSINLSLAAGGHTMGARPVDPVPILTKIGQVYAP